MIEIKDYVIKTQNGQPLFSPLSLEIAAGEMVTLMGASGIGKSTLIDALGGYLDPEFTSEGSFMIDGEDMSAVPAHKRGIGVMFQDANLFAHLSVGANIGLAIPCAIKGRKARAEAIRASLQQAGLDGFETRDPATLSGGQKTRVALMRTLASAPRFLMLDEPFSKLDGNTKSNIRKFVFDHIAQTELPTLLVTHDRDDANGRIVTLTPAER